MPGRAHRRLSGHRSPERPRPLRNSRPRSARVRRHIPMLACKAKRIPYGVLTATVARDTPYVSRHVRHQTKSGWHQTSTVWIAAVAEACGMGDPLRHRRPQFGAPRRNASDSISRVSGPSTLSRQMLRGPPQKTLQQTRMKGLQRGAKLNSAFIRAWMSQQSRKHVKGARQIVVSVARSASMPASAIYPQRNPVLPLRHCCVRSQQSDTSPHSRSASGAANQNHMRKFI